jgi:asparagine synthase (glutamine-hydrolysing)
MCGLVAFFAGSTAVPLPTARRALDALRHRGPDAGGEWQEDGVFLGHRRLSIIDLKTGQQPMHSWDDRYVIVFNGEIYNYRELRHQLEAAGAQFCTRSDTEVILEGYRHWGAAVVEKLNGMFAFVIWDRLTRSAFVARDRLGIKPLCWAMKDGGLIISSTLEPFAGLGAFDELDPVAIRDLMTFDYIPAPRTIRTAGPTTRCTRRVRRNWRNCWTIRCAGRWSAMCRSASSFRAASIPRCSSR